MMAKGLKHRSRAIRSSQRQLHSIQIANVTGTRSETHQTHSAAHQTRSGNIACTEGYQEHLSEANASETG